MGEYAEVNGIRLYFEQHGDKASPATPLVLLHGGIGGIEMFGPNIAALATDRRVIGVDLQVTAAPKTSIGLSATRRWQMTSPLSAHTSA